MTSDYEERPPGAKAVTSRHADHGHAISIWAGMP
ncbi:hypothetical protein ATK30_4889 [Amycolatopsis echigonensis]|uniref:Uncharacterized protein n=1 Tax=Amycolatopsis echigonensis TaxID=2576905 RepID=A0A2N3WJG9_9PSEU|nr:hypothetical protein ATK30_4889 [Amycolatopsis niigatensis]